jgi:cytochrome c553
LLAWRSAAGLFFLGLMSTVATLTSASAEDALDRELSQCWSCHGQTGRSSDSTIPVIWGQNAAYITKQLNDYRDGSRDSQIMSSMAEGIARARFVDAAERIAMRPWPDPEESISKNHLTNLAQACTACHGADLKGGQTDKEPAPRLAGQNERYLMDQMQAFSTALRGNQPVMTSIMSGIDAAQREALAKELAHYTP